MDSRRVLDSLEEHGRTPRRRCEKSRGQRSRAAFNTFSSIPDFFQSMTSSAESAGFGRWDATHAAMTSAPTPASIIDTIFFLSSPTELTAADEADAGAGDGAGEIVGRVAGFAGAGAALGAGPAAGAGAAGTAAGADAGAAVGAAADVGDVAGVLFFANVKEKTGPCIGAAFACASRRSTASGEQA